jgi:hypothetical protein
MLAVEAVEVLDLEALLVEQQLKLLGVRVERRPNPETNHHRVSCSMVDKVDVQASAQRHTSPRSQRSARSTYDSLQLSMRSAECSLFNISDDRSLASHHAFGRLCLRSRRFHTLNARLALPLGGSCLFCPNFEANLGHVTFLWLFPRSTRL